MKTLLLWLWPAVALAQTNLLANGDFESGVNGWNAGGVTASTAQHQSGAQSAYFVDNQQLDTQVTTTPGHRYKLTGWVKIATESGSDWGGFRFELQTQSFQTLASSGYFSQAANGTAWFKVSVGFTAIGNSTRVYVGYFGGAGRHTTVYADDLELFEAPAMNTPPTVTASFGASSVAAPGTLDYSLSYDDPDGAVRRVDWDFGDGFHAQALSGSHRVAVPGTYTARVRVSDDDGAVVTQTLPWTATAVGWPTLTVSAPAQVQSSSVPLTITSSGTVVASDDVETVTNPSSITVKPGWNRVLVQASDAAGHLVSLQLTVRYLPQEPLAVTGVTLSASTVGQYEPLEVTFDVAGSAATQPQFPYEPSPAPGLESLDGTTVDALFSLDGFATAYRRPAFLHQRFDRAQKANEEWLSPTTAQWTARFAPPLTGQWKVRIEVREAKGRARSAESGFNVSSATGPGPIRVSANDARYFEHADCSPFLGTGHNLRVSDERYGYELLERFTAMGSGNQQLFRFWISGDLWGSAWQPWRSRTLGYDGTVPNTGFTLDAVYGDGLAALELDPQSNPIMFQGWLTGHAAVERDATYRVRVRWRTDGLTGPATAGQPYGVALKWGGFPEPGQTGSFPVILAHEHGDTAWHVTEATFTANGAATQLGGDFLANPVLVVENATGGRALVDEVSVREVTPGGLGPEILRGPKMNSHLGFDPHRAEALDEVLREGAAMDKALKLVLSEKQDFLLNALGGDGLPAPNGGFYDGSAGTPTHALHTYAWRHLSARWGAYRALHSFELANEEAPNFSQHFANTDELARTMAEDGNPHLASTSTWASLAESAWDNAGAADISFTDFHAYVRSTGWLEPKDTLAKDSAGLFIAYDAAAADAGFGKPVVWGEQGIDGNSGSDTEDPDLARDDAGVWLHKMVWARTGPGGVVPLYWYTDNIFDKPLHGVFGAWRSFMADVPLTNGRYAGAAPAVTGALRAVGQKDIAAGRAHVWVDNPAHTWRSVVDGVTPSAVSGSVALMMGVGDYTLQWFDTSSGAASGSTTQLTADASGVVTVNVTTATDAAFKLSRVGAMAPADPLCAAMAGAAPYVDWPPDDGGTAMPDAGPMGTGGGSGGSGGTSSGAGGGSAVASAGGGTNAPPAFGTVHGGCGCGSSPLGAVGLLALVLLRSPRSRRQG